MDAQGLKEFLWRAWHWLVTSRYTAWLEDEVERLRAENRALTNSLLSTAGVAPIDPPKLVSRENRRMTRYQRQVQLEREAFREQMKGGNA